ncbi:acyl-CoA dehydratase activase-related protein [Eubacteriales bacterium OttesenSCG-928-M02]|nr:acyl-CoA dehydratase activase-related protein [Eubacteriales bacterium OttesenSCG-928-M02]
MTVGIPQAFLYHRYHVLWESFFAALGIEVVKSGPSDKKKEEAGTRYAIDESCLSNKIYLGHVEALIGKCDAIFVPRIANYGNGSILCTKFEALYDIVQNTFREQGIKLVDMNVDYKRDKGELGAFQKLGKQLGKKRTQSTYAYILAKQMYQNHLAEEVRKQMLKLNRRGMKILVVGHSYNVYDALIGQPVIKMLEEMGAVPIIADVVDKKEALTRATELTDTLPYLYNRELVGSVQIYRDQVDGIILLSAFPCGPDALVNDILQRRVKGKPMLTLLMDNQEGSAGMETRMESFLDIIQFQKEGGMKSA